MRSAVFMLFLVSSGTVSAQPSPAVDARAARIQFMAGNRFYNQGQWDEAVGAFTRALELAPLATRDEIYWNIARCHERAGRLHEAIAGYNRYLSFNPPEAAVQRTEQHMTELYARIQSQRSTPLPPRVEPPPAKAPRPSVRVVTHRPRPVPLRPGWLLGRRFTWVAGGTSLALGIGAGVAWILTSSSYGDLADTCGASRAGCSSSDVNGVRTGVLATNVLLVGAGLTLAAAAALFAIEGDLGEQPSQEAAIRLSLAPSGVGLVW